MFEADIGLMIWTWISFVILLVLVTKFAYKPLLAVINQREETIRKTLEDSENARVQAEELITKQRKELDNAKLEVKRMIDEGRVSGENVKKDVVEKARDEAEQIISRARDEITKEKEKAIIDLQGEVADFSIKIASKVINKVLTKEEHIDLLNKSIAEVKAI